LFAAKTLAATAVDLMSHPKYIEAAKKSWNEQMKGRQYFSLIPKGQKTPTKVRKNKKLCEK